MVELAGVATTALVVAMGRAIESDREDRLFDDPWAQRFIDAAGLTTPDASQTAAGRGAAWVVVRTRFIDDFVAAASNHGIVQMVIVGAGLDSRALRLSWSRPTRVYELDAPAMFAFKDPVISMTEQPSLAERLCVPVDVTAPWTDPLLATWFNPELATTWIVEGLLLYLTPEQGDGLIATISSVSAEGSRLVMTLTPPGQQNRDRDRADHGIGYHNPYWVSDAPEDPIAWLQRHGWRARQFHPARYAHQYGRQPAPGEDTTDPPRRILVTAIKH